MLQIRNLSKSYGTQILFNGLTFSVNPGERIGLVGRNGYGKTTLFNIILGSVKEDSGEIIIPKGYRIGHLEQEISFSHPSILAEACSAFGPSDVDESWKAKKILAGLGFPSDILELAPCSLSSGFQIRLNLAKAVLSDPELLLLDEPNNYLDIVSIRWLKGFLRSWKKELLIISHDRDFMDSVTTHTMIIHRQIIRKFRGSAENALTRIKHEEEVHEKTRLNFEKKRQKTEEYVRRFRAKARMAKSVQSTVKALEKQKEIVKLQQIKSLSFSFSSEPLKAATVMSAKKLSYSHTPCDNLISGFSLEVGNRDRICVTGKNGKGKTTLLKLLSGALQHRSGTVKSHPDLRGGSYLESEIKNLNAHKTVFEEILLSASVSSNQRVRDICGMLMFEGDAALKKIEVLSGGEKSRVLLGKVLARPCNLLFLDEPTNHLDLESCEALISAIDEFEGAVILVTHNEGFLRRLAERLVIFDDSGIRVFEGTYDDFLSGGGWGDENPAEPSEEASDDKASPDRKKTKKIEAEIRQERYRVLKPLEKEIRRLEERIALLEDRKAGNTGLLIQASGSGDGEAIAGLAKKDKLLGEEIESLYLQLDETLRLHSDKSAHFEELLNSLSSG